MRAEAWKTFLFFHKSELFSQKGNCLDEFSRIFCAKGQIFISIIILAHAQCTEKIYQKYQKMKPSLTFCQKLTQECTLDKIFVHKLDVGPWRPRIPFSARKLKRVKGCLVQEQQQALAAYR
jgi:hypothetical protein